MHLKYKIISVIAGLLLSVSIVSSIINYRIDVLSTQDQLKNISLPLSIDNIYTEIQQRIIEPLIVSSLMANDTFLKDWVIYGEKDIKSIQKYLQELQKKYQIFTSFLVSDDTKNYYHSKGIIDKINKNNVEDDWYFNFKKSPDLYEVNLDYNKNLGDSLVMFINYKVKDYANDFIAITGVGIKLLEVEKMLRSFKQKYKYDVYFADENGEIVLFTKELNKRGNISSIEGLKDIQADIFANKINKFEYTYKDNEYLLSTKYIKKLKLYLLVEIDKKEYMEDLNKTFYMNLTISVIVTLLVVLIIIYTINIYQKQLELLADEDSLTGLANRRKFNENFEKMFDLYYRRNLKSLALILIDIDDFKSVNDTFGHLTGDKTLVRFSELLKSEVRKTDILARWGGEEFAILLIDTTKEEAIQIAEKIRVAVKEDVDLHRLLEKQMTISLGLGELTSNDSQDGLILKVDEALYKAKNAGKDQLIII
ncbi:sensor domain-containing diguanylate cyclase [Sulfurospirillum arcachonense]|uniref:sensor domain-containing diguanylate cyclase n=1 Tax=Sulfurospirillum arcachonense TaxID=57666 RepID=UPI0004690C6A|nr:sensor domain-containing diguanylate cyclase [Sulfurospirillum arcachonense]